MNRLLFVVLLVSICACGIIGDGKATGYITAVEDGMFWGKVFIKGDAQSSESDCYIIRKDSNMYAELKDLVGSRVFVVYKKHFLTCTIVNEGEGGDCQIFSFKQVK
jgi:hypothetical protein